MTLPEIFASSFAVGFSGAIVPGPVLSVAVAAAARRGATAGPMVALGHGIAEALLVAVLWAGIVHLSAQSLAMTLISVSGGGILLWMGGTMVAGAVRGTTALDLRAQGGRAKALGPVAMGALASVSNPFWHLWWATVGASYIVQAQAGGAGPSGGVAFFTGHVLSDFVWYSLVAALVAFGRGWLSKRVYRGVFLICGLFLIGMGVYFARWGMRL